MQKSTWTRVLGRQRALIQLQDTLMEPYCAELDHSEWKSSFYWTETKTRRAGGNSPSCSQWRLCPLLVPRPCGVQPLLLSANHNAPSMHTQQTHKYTQLTNVSKKKRKKKKKLSTVLINPAHSPRGPRNRAQAKMNASHTYTYTSSKKEITLYQT